MKIVDKNLNDITIVSVEGNEIQFLGWPTTVTLNVDDDDNDDVVVTDDDDEMDL